MSQRRAHALEIRVGMFVVIGLALFIGFIFSIGDLSTVFRPSYQLRILFGSANGIADGAPVQYAGVEVGKVQAVRLVGAPDHTAPQVELVVRLPSDVRVRSDDVASISTFGLLGEKYLEITPGPGAGPVLAAGGRLVGKPPVSTEDVIERSNQVLTEFQQTLQGINSFVGDPEARLYFKEVLSESRNATRHWRALGERLNMAMVRVESGQGSLGHFLYDDDLYERVVLLVEDLRAHPWKLLSRGGAKKEKPMEQQTP